MNEILYLMLCFLNEIKEIIIFGFHLMNSPKIIYYVILLSLIYPITFFYINDHKITSIFFGSIFLLVLLKKSFFLYLTHHFLVKKYALCSLCHEGIKINEYHYLMTNIFIVLLPILIIDGLCLIFQLWRLLKNKVWILIVDRMPLGNINTKPQGLLSFWCIKKLFNICKYIVNIIVLSFLYILYLFALFIRKIYHGIQLLGKWAQIKLKKW
jgi:hypothetical protein